METGWRSLLTFDGFTISRQVNIVAEVLGSPPQGKFSDTEEYYKLVCPQLLEMLASEESVVSMIACSSIKVCLT